RGQGQHGTGDAWPCRRRRHCGERLDPSLSGFAVQAPAHPAVVLFTMRNPAPWPSPVQPAGPLPPDQPRRSGIKWKFVIVAGMAGGLLGIGGLLAMNSPTKRWDPGRALGGASGSADYPGPT